MRLIACQECHTQYDVSHVAEPTVRCRCGVDIENRELEAVEARIYRCGSCSAQVESSDTHCEYCGSQIIRDEGRLSLICPECFCRNAEDARFCTACGVTFDPESVEVKGVELPCPCCGCLMAVRQLIGIALNECAECNGLWVPGDRMEVLVRRAIEARERALASPGEELDPRKKGSNPYGERVQYRKCPECERFMARSNFRKTSGIIIDQCPDHGTWLDADELENMAGFIMSGGRPEADAFMRQQDSEDHRQRTKMAAMQADMAQRQFMPSSRGDEGGGLLGLLFELLR